MSVPDWIAKTDPLNFSTVKLETYYNEVKVGDATGFFVEGDRDGEPYHWLVTNWHVLTGRNADDPNVVLHKQGAIPNRLKLSLFLRPDQPEYKGQPFTALMQELFIGLFDADGRAEWSQHQRMNALDVAVISPPSHAFDRFHIVGVNEAALQTDMAVEIGNEVFILGFPLGFTHYALTPIWKRGSIATDPIFETPETGSRVVIDATTRGGMSGAPVIMRTKTHYMTETGELLAHHNATRWIGIYASRPVLTPSSLLGEEDRRAEVGYFFKNMCVVETIKSGVRGPNFSTLPN